MNPESQNTPREEPSLYRTLYGSIVDAALARRGAEAVDSLLELAWVDGAYPPIRHCLSEQLPETDRSTWKNLVLSTALLREETVRVSRQFQETGLDHVVLKGAPLAQLLHGSARARQSTDVDLLVRPEDVLDSIELLVEQLGYGRPDLDALKPWTSNQLLLRHAESGLLLELHWLLAKPEEFLVRLQPDWSATDTVEIRGIEVPVLGEQDLFTHLCLHAVQHDCSLKTVGDLAAWVDHCGPSCLLRARERALRQIGVAAVEWPLTTLDYLIGSTSSRKTSTTATCLATLSATRILRAYVDGLPFNRPLYPQVERGFWANVLGVLELGAVRAVISSGRPFSQLFQSIFLGPHRLGRAAISALERTGLVDRADMIERSPPQALIASFRRRWGR